MIFDVNNTRKRPLKLIKINKMKTLIAFFDLLGFKEFILSNDDATISHYMENILVRVELSLSDQKTQKKGDMVVANIQNTVTHCTNFSDSFVFWIEDLNQEAIDDFFGVVYRFNSIMTTSIMPVRGAIVLASIGWRIDQQKNIKGAKYNVNMAYGKGIIEAYTLSEGQNWAGAIIDPLIFDERENKGINVTEIKAKFVPYEVPLKENTKGNYLALRLVKDKTYPKTFADNVSKGIRASFKIKAGENVPETVQAKYDNTIKFLNSFVDQSTA